MHKLISNQKISALNKPRKYIFQFLTLKPINLYIQQFHFHKSLFRFYRQKSNISFELFDQQK